MLPFGWRGARGPHVRGSKPSGESLETGAWRLALGARRLAPEARTCAAANRMERVRKRVLGACRLGACGPHVHLLAFVRAPIFNPIFSRQRLSRVLRPAVW